MAQPRYSDFLQHKAVTDSPTGLSKVPPLNKNLYPFQKDIVSWALRRGRAAVFADCGMGKSLMSLSWAEHVPGDVLILAPLALAPQTVREGSKFGIDVTICRKQSDVRPGINITNYEMLEHFDPGAFRGVVLDESSIIKSQDGATRKVIIEAFQRTPFRLACTATPSPNDYMELGNHAEFLGVMTYSEMLSMFFVHDGGETQKWRLKGHAQQDFWKWLCSWGVMIRKPSDLGYEDGGFVLPPLKLNEHIVTATKPTDGMLFALPAASLQERISARRETILPRSAECTRIIMEDLSNDEERIYALLGDQEPGKGQGISREDKGSKECEAQVSICTATRNANESDPNIEAMDSKSSRKKKDAEDQKIRNYPGTIQHDPRKPGRQMCDMRDVGQKRQKSVSAGGSLSRDGKGAGNNMRFLQSRSGEICGQPVEVVESRGLSDVRHDKWIIWCHLNAEQEHLAKLLGDLCVSIQGSTPNNKKCELEEKWRDGGVPVMISKPSVFGYGMNWQHCHNMAFVGLSDSFEEFYQAVRRCWRFGQKKPVNVHIIIADTEGAVLANIKRKEADAAKMADEMVANMGDLSKQSLKGGTKREKAEYKIQSTKGNGWELRLGDCVEGLNSLDKNSVHYSIYSPPFSSLYTYSNSDRDMGNSKDYDQFFEHYQFMVDALYRSTMPGRLTSFHCMDLPTSKVRDGVIGLRDFRGDLIRSYEKAGWILHSQVVIWKDPVTAMQRTKALGLLHKQLKKDSCMSRQGVPDYLVTMRKPGDNPEPVSHTNDTFPVHVWQKYASPVWMDINPNETLQYRSARENNDERHICPLQLEVIRRALELWSNPNDLVLSPFAGIGSEGYESVVNGRRFIGFELKESYYKCAISNLAAAEAKVKESVLF